MAGLIGLTASDIEIQDALGIGRWEYEGEWIPHPVVRLTTTLPVGVRRSDGPAVVRARWGFDVGDGRPIGNARDDRLLESRLWSGLLGKGHCLFVATGIYEQVKGPPKASYWFRGVDGRPIVMPGLCGERTLGGEKRLCAVIVTTKPNRFFGGFHDRQVCTLARDELMGWLACGDAGAARGLLHAPAEDDWEAVPVEDRIFRPGRVELEHLVATGPPVRAGGKVPPTGTVAAKAGRNRTLF